MGTALGRGGGRPRSWFRPRYRLRLRRAVPALVLLLGLSVLAGGVWLRVLDRVEAGAAPAAGCVGGGSTSGTGRVEIRVYNSTVREGLAKSVADQLRRRGFVVIATANDPLIDIRDVRAAAEVRYGALGAKQAEQVRRQVPGAKLFKDTREDAVVDLAVGAAYKRLATEAELTRGRQGFAGMPLAAEPAC